MALVRTTTAYGVIIIITILICVAQIQIELLYTECQSSFVPVSYWLRTYHVIVEKFYCLPGNVAKRWTLLLFTGK